MTGIMISYLVFIHSLLPNIKSYSDFMLNIFCFTLIN
ncbi:Uncharacterised protein [Vibrio cholerae]|nr:Uncharacterised protein [Vibrio cholerae]